MIHIAEDALVLGHTIDDVHLMTQLLEFAFQGIALQYGSVVLCPVKGEYSYFHSVHVFMLFLLRFLESVYTNQRFFSFFTTSRMPWRE